jgi:NAD(P)H-nitrite reductase large subunit
VVRHVDQGDGVYKRLAFRDGSVVGAIYLGDRTDVRPIQQLMIEGRRVAVYGERLVDGSLDLKALAAGETPA